MNRGNPQEAPERDLRKLIAGGAYQVNPAAVAEAILARHGARGGIQRLCSEMLVAPQALVRRADEGQPPSADDAS